MKLFQYIVCIYILILPVLLNAQGNVGIGTSTPLEKLDVNGAIIITGGGVAATPIPGTIRWNVAEGWHEGRTSLPAYVKLENSEIAAVDDYTAYSGCTSPVTLGVFEASNPATGYGMPSYLASPFNTWWGGDRTQLLYRASELSAAGLCAGNINMVGFITVAPGAYTLASLEIKLKNTATNTLTTYETGLTSYYTSGLYTLVAGNNDFNLAVPFVWDGTSNVCIEVCWNNNILALATGCIVQLDNGYGYNTAYGYYADLTPTICSGAFTPQASTSRPVTRFGSSGALITTGVDTYYTFNDAIVVGNPLLFYGADNRGPGTVTAESVYDDNSLLSDYVFDEYFDKEVKETDLENCEEYRHLSIAELEEFVSLYRHLPNIAGRDEWEQNGSFSLGELLTDLWISAEDQALYIKEIYERSELIEQQLINNRTLLIKKLNEGILLINEDIYLSAVTKQKKINEIETMITKLHNL